MKMRTLLRGMMAAALGVVAAAPLAAAQPYNGLYVFGDSLVDAGNIAVITGGTTPNPAAGYFQGRFTNGLNYVDYLSFHLTGQVTRASLTGGRNYAYGGARVVTDTVDAIPDLTAQINAYRAASSNIADPNALYVLNMGGNDVFAINRFNAGQTNQLNPIGNVAAYKAAVVDIYANSVIALNQIGAKNILITGIPNATDPLGIELDGMLQARLNTLSLSQGTNLFRFSYVDFFTRVATNPGSLGLPPLRTDQSCIQLQAQATGCVGIFSFDGTHPTAAVQRAVFDDMIRQFALATVPEPQTWAMMILGFGAVGFTVRRQRRVAFA